MGTLVTGAMALCISLAASGVCHAQFVATGSQGNPQVVKQEPLEGKMSPGQVLLVDDGTCGKGRIKEVTGGEVATINYRPRTRRCIARPTK
jgi:hypothetical protein